MQDQLEETLKKTLINYQYPKHKFILTEYLTPLPLKTNPCQQGFTSLLRLFICEMGGNVLASGTSLHLVWTHRSLFTLAGLGPEQKLLHMIPVKLCFIFTFIYTFFSPRSRGSNMRTSLTSMLKNFLRRLQMAIGFRIMGVIQVGTQLSQL